MRGKSLVILFIFSFLFLSSNASAQETTVSGGAKVSDPSNTGSASAGIPIEVPPGRNGIAPNLALTYSSNGGNGWVGVGWDIGLGEIMRSTKRGVSYNPNETDDCARYQLMIPKSEKTG